MRKNIQISEKAIPFQRRELLNPAWKNLFTTLFGIMLLGFILLLLLQAS